VRCWDFVFDRTTSGDTLKWLPIVDKYTRECPALKVDRSTTSEDETDTLAELFAMRSVPQPIRSDEESAIEITKPIRDGAKSALVDRLRQAEIPLALP
jgi:hypothetical protein